MKAEEIRNSFIEFFRKKSHQVVDSSSLIPADPTVLFTSAGMQQFIPYLSGEADPPYKRACSVQKCFRTSDIDEVGDEFHHTFFEMLGNWSLGDYFKKEAIDWALELLIDNYHLEKSRLWVTIFKGEKDVPIDSEAKKFWLENGIADEKIKEFGLETNFWGPVGSFGPCGPCSEIHYDRGKEFQAKECTLPGCGPNCGCGRFVEIWNLVFMEYNKTEMGGYVKLPAQNVDTGAGLERLTCVLQNRKSDYETELFQPLMEEINRISRQKDQNIKAARIITDHLRGICFLIADGALPGKEDRGYVLRKMIRRTMRYGRLLEMGKDFLIPLAEMVIDRYKIFYPELEKGRNDILTIIQKEQEKFEQTLSQGLKKFNYLAETALKQGKQYLDPETVFHLYDTYGFPLELTGEMAREHNLKIDEEAFKRQFELHKEVSRAGVKNKFGGVGEWGEKVASHHTATHLLHQALRRVLGNHVQQAGSDLTPERLRFDFTHQEKLTEEQIKEVEEIVNQIIKQGLKVRMEEMPYEEAIKLGALAFFKEKYPKTVRVYSVGGDSSTNSEPPFSREICAGPHVKNTGEIGNFKIIKEEASGAGIRRIKATVG